MRGRRKYGNRPVVVDGVRYASVAEAKRAAALKLLERAGQITDLRHQPRFPIDVNGVRVCVYVADAAYRENGALVVEDTKGVLTDVFRLKAKLMKAVHGIDVRVVK